MSVNDAHLARIVATPDFDTNFAAVDIFVGAVGEPAALDAAQAWCAHGEPLQRAAGLDVLAVLAMRDDGCFHALLAAAEAVTPAHVHEDLRWSAAHALSSNPRPGALPVLLRFLQDPDGDVRWQVAVGLSELATNFTDDDPAVQGLRVLATDDDHDIRSKAELGLRQVRGRFVPG